LRVQLSCGVAKESLADEGATERQSGAAPGSSPHAGTASFDGIVPAMNRLQHPRVSRWKGVKGQWPHGRTASPTEPCFGKGVHIV
jgi:hypothetical protein